VEIVAARGGVERGDVLTAVGGSAVKTLGDFDGSVAKLKPGDSVAVALRRAGTQQTATIKIPAETGGNR